MTVKILADEDLTGQQTNIFDPANFIAAELATNKVVVVLRPAVEDPSPFVNGASEQFGQGVAECYALSKNECSSIVNQLFNVGTDNDSSGDALRFNKPTATPHSSSHKLFFFANPKWTWRRAVDHA